ncbi:hypothetical protein BDM02DRAFT_3117627 [Thelephora ganbajun]|uniref:Uncharacterized protein n=1 Tax=Thelephora ganbajun TaxID=370292 RepID=A0ACB6ZCK1_THEGA|nr:hypothetical protein BDM02DRAFT_3117627 [Thelephora ganbajun]
MEMWWLSVPFALVLCLVLSWLSTGDDDINIHESTIMRVSLRNPVRESGPPACMAKLIMMRHRINQVNSKKKGGNASTRHRSHSPSPVRKLAPPPLLPFSTKSRNLAWLRFNRRSGKQFH